MAAVNCSFVITPTTDEEAPTASYSDPAGRGTDGSCADALGSGGTAVEAGGGSDIGSGEVSDTRLLRLKLRR